MAEIQFHRADGCAARIYPLTKGGATVDLSPYMQRKLANAGFEILKTKKGRKFRTASVEAAEDLLKRAWAYKPEEREIEVIEEEKWRLLERLEIVEAELSRAEARDAYHGRLVNSRTGIPLGGDDDSPPWDVVD